MKDELRQQYPRSNLTDQLSRPRSLVLAGMVGGEGGKFRQEGGLADASDSGYSYGPNRSGLRYAPQGRLRTVCKFSRGAKL